MQLLVHAKKSACCDVATRSICCGALAVGADPDRLEDLAAACSVTAAGEP